MRTFLVALRPSTTIAVQICVAVRASTAITAQICANGSLSDFAVFERSEAAKSATPVVRTQQKIFFVSREVRSSSAVPPPPFARQIIFSC